MGRLIDADKLKLHYAWWGSVDNYTSDTMTYPEAKAIVDTIIDLQPTIEAKPRWIPIEQDCPEKGKDVLISHNGVVSIDWLTQSEGVGYFFVSGVAVQDIDAWMPLPEPYREVED